MTPLIFRSRPGKRQNICGAIGWAICLATVSIPVSSLTAQPNPAKPIQATEATAMAIDIAGGDLNGRRVIFLGDSITAAGTHLGYLETVLMRRFPGQTFDFISAGLPSETVSGLTEPDHPFPRPCLLERLERVLKKSKPDYVIACYGMNDGIYHPASEERTKAFHEGINQLIDACKQSGARIVLITPPAFDAKSAKGVVPKDADLFGYKTPYEDYSKVMAEYGQWLMDRDDILAIDVHSPLTAWLEKEHAGDPEFRSGDGVHPKEIGYMALAMAILNGLGIELPDTSPQSALDRIQQDPIYAAVEARRSARSKGWMRHTGYIRGPKQQQPEPLGDTESTAAAQLKEIKEELATH